MHQSLAVTLRCSVWIVNRLLSSLRSESFLLQSSTCPIIDTFVGLRVTWQTVASLRPLDHLSLVGYCWREDCLHEARFFYAIIAQVPIGAVHLFPAGPAYYLHLSAVHLTEARLPAAGTNPLQPHTV
ncbi:hypothetical protein KCV07_g111, partial [Aureobasidium melanogenum]